MPDQISCSDFAQFLVDQQPHYDKEIVKDIRPTDGWIGHVSTGEFPAHSGVSLYQDRFNSVFPNTTRPFRPKTYESCIGNPCAKEENLIGWGAERLSYALEQQEWATQLLCFDQMMHVSKAKENWSYIISSILKPATSAIMSNFLRKKALYWAGKKFVANSNFGYTASEFSFIWEEDADGNEVYLLTSKLPTSKLTPQMLKRRVNPLMLTGYFGSDVFKRETSPPMIELVTGLDTLWDLARLGGAQGTGTDEPNVQNNWRFQEWDAANKYWRYGFSGQIGNFAARVDAMELRFNLVTENSGNATYPYKFQVVLPYVNEVTSGAGGAPGLKSVPNPDYERARYRFSLAWHKEAMQALMMEPTSINPELPFGSRNFGGKWKFVLPENCVQPDGTVTALDNRRKNYGQFLADFLLAIRPFHTEFAEVYFHMAEPPCVTEITPCGDDPGYPTQDYNSANSLCEDLA
jgi:hypothetical protein